jgi:hypothetical protein
MSQVDASIPLSAIQIPLMNPQQLMSLQNMSLNNRAARLEFQAAQEERQKKQKLDAFMTDYVKKYPDARDPLSGVWSTKTIVDLQKAGFTDSADKVLKARIDYMKADAHEQRELVKTAAEEDKARGSAVKGILQDAYAEQRSDTTTKDPEVRKQNWTNRYQKAIKDWIATGVPAKLGYKQDDLQKLVDTVPSENSVPFRLLKIDKMVERLDANEIGKLLGGNSQQEPSPTSVPLSEVGQSKTEQAPSAMSTDPGTTPVTTKTLPPDTVEAKPIAQNEAPALEVVGKRPPETPDSMRAQAARLEKLGTTGGLKYATHLRSAANQLEQRIQAQEKELRISAKQNATGALGNSPRVSRLSETAIDTAAFDFMINNKLPPNIARSYKGEMGPEARDIINRAAEKQKKLGLSDQEVAVIRANNKALAPALAQLQKQSQSIEAFERTLQYNIREGLKISNQIPRTDSTIANSTLRAIREQGLGGPQVQDLIARLFVRNEAIAAEVGKIMSGSMGNSQLAQSAQEHARKLVNGDMPLHTYEAAVREINDEVEKGRTEGLRRQVDQVLGQMTSPGRTREATRQPAEGLPPPADQKSDEDFSHLWKKK